MLRLYRNNAWTRIEGLTPALRERLHWHLAVHLQTDQPTKGVRFGRIWMYNQKWYGSMLHDARDGIPDRVPAGLTRHVAWIAQQQGMPVDVYDDRKRPAEAYPWHAMRPLAWRPYQDQVHDSILIHGSGVIVAPPRCLAGDTVVQINRAGKSFDIALRDLVHSFNGEATIGGKGSMRRWNASIKTTIRARNPEGMILLYEIKSATCSGVKPLLRLLTTSGHELRASADHNVLTTGGWKALGQITAADMVYEDGGLRRYRKKRKPNYAFMSNLFAHPNAGRRGRNPDKGSFCVQTHRLVVEAARNGLTLREFVARIRAREIGGLCFLDPSEHVHHIDEDPKNNDLSNLEVLTNVEHAKRHGEQRAWRHVTRQTRLVAVASVEPDSTEETFDLEVPGAENFIASGIVVHNSGKTYMAARAVDALSMPALYIAPSVPIVRQTYETFCKLFGENMVARLDGEATDEQRKINKPIVVSTAASAIRQSAEWWQTRQVLVLDEAHHCLSPTTQILTPDGAKPISAIRENDFVFAASGLPRRVLRVWRRKGPRKWLRIVTREGSLDVTAEHEIYTTAGKTRARRLHAGDFLRALPEGVLSEGAFCAACAGLHRAETYASCLSEVREAGSSAQLRRTSNSVFRRESYVCRSGVPQARDESKIGELGLSEATLRTHEEAEHRTLAGNHANDESGSGQGVCGWQNSALWEHRALGQGRRNDAICAADLRAVETLRFHTRSCGAHWSAATSSEALQSRFCEQEQDDRCRSRRKISRDAVPESSGREEGRCLDRSRLASVACTCAMGLFCEGLALREILAIEEIEAASSDVYDLEVEHEHNYFAGGVLVSNSASNTWHEINQLAAHIYHRLAFTGTYFRTGGDDLAMHAVTGDVLFQITVSDLVEQKYLAKPKVFFLNYKAPRVGDGPWHQLYERGIVQMEARNKLVVSTANFLMEQGDRIIVLTRRRAHADLLGKMLQNSVVVKGGEGALTSGAVRDFLRGRHQVLVGTTVIGEGVDVPAASALIYASGGSDGVQLIQSYFRPMTLHAGKPTGRIYDFVDKQHRLLDKHSTERMDAAREHLGNENVFTF